MTETQLDRIEAKLDKLLEALSEEDNDDDQQRAEVRTLDGEVYHLSTSDIGHL